MVGYVGTVCMQEQVQDSQAGIEPYGGFTFDSFRVEAYLSNRRASQ